MENMLFGCELKDNQPETISEAKRLIYNTARELGFEYHEEFKIGQYRDPATSSDEWRISALFYNKPPELII